MRQPLDFLAFEADFSRPDVLVAYDELPLWSAMFGLLLLEEVPLRGVRAALDVGCGTGFPLLEIAERLGSTADVHGVDVWAAGLQRAREKARARATPNVTLHECSAAAMPFADQSFDLIVSNLGVNNFDDRDAAIGECRRVARSGASLALTTNLQGHMGELYAVFDEVLGEAGDEESRGRLQRHIEHRATVPGVRELLERHDFAIRRVIERAGLLRFADGAALLNHHFVKLAFLDGWRGVVAGDPSRLFGRLLQRLDAVARQEGELRLTIPMAYVEASAGGRTASRRSSASRRGG
jgi:ubiquinone/menaquinone biosynthesis C-methylase UbiE